MYYELGAQTPEHSCPPWCTTFREETHSRLRALWSGRVVFFDIRVRNISKVFVFKDLKKYFDSLNGEIDGDVVKSLMFQLLRGLNFCHTHNVLHRFSFATRFPSPLAYSAQGLETTESSDKQKWRIKASWLWLGTGVWYSCAMLQCRGILLYWSDELNFALNASVT